MSDDDERRRRREEEIRRRVQARMAALALQGDNDEGDNDPQPQTQQPRRDSGGGASDADDAPPPPPDSDPPPPPAVDPPPTAATAAPIVVPRVQLNLLPSHEPEHKQPVAAPAATSDSAEKKKPIDISDDDDSTSDDDDAEFHVAPAPSSAVKTVAPPTAAPVVAPSPVKLKLPDVSPPSSSAPAAAAANRPPSPKRAPAAAAPSARKPGSADTSDFDLTDDDDAAPSDAAKQGVPVAKKSSATPLRSGFADRDADFSAPSSLRATSASPSLHDIIPLEQLKTKADGDGADDDASPEAPDAPLFRAPLLSFSGPEAIESLARCGDAASALSLKSYLARREQNRCLGPLPSEEIVGVASSSSAQLLSTRTKPCSQSIQLGFFRAPQRVVAWRREQVPPSSGADVLALSGDFVNAPSPLLGQHTTASAADGSAQPLLSTMPLWSDLERKPFERESGEVEENAKKQQQQQQQQNATAVADMHKMRRDENLSLEPSLVDIKLLGDIAATPVSSTASTIDEQLLSPALLDKLAASTPDVIQLWDVVRDLGPRTLSTYNRFWTSDYNCGSHAHKGAPLPAQFSRGAVLRVEVGQLSSQLHEQFGGTGADSIYCAAALFVAPEGSAATPLKLSETMYFAPHGQEARNASESAFHLASFCTFVPNEFRASRLMLALRVYRTMTSDAETAADMYVRPAAYRKSYHDAMVKAVAEARQNSPTAVGPLLQELGFGFQYISALPKPASIPADGAKKSVRFADPTAAAAPAAASAAAVAVPAPQSDKVTLLIDKLYKPPKSTSEATMLMLIGNDTKRGNLKTINMKLVLHVENVTKLEPVVPRRINPNATSAVEDESFICFKSEQDGADSIDEKASSPPSASTAQQHPQQQQQQPKNVSRYVPCCRPLLNAGCFSHFVHVLYLRLARLNLTNLVPPRGTPSLASFAVQVALKDNDATLSGDGLPCCYMRHVGVSMLENCAWSAASFGSKDCEFNDEVKLQLPLMLHDRHHLFLTVYGFSAAAPSAGQPPVVVGYAALPIYKDGGLSAGHDNLKLPLVAAEAARGAAGAGGYLKALASMPPTSLCCGGESILTLSTALRSTVQSSHPNLSRALGRIAAVCDKTTIPATTATERFECDEKHRQQQQHADDDSATAEKSPTAAAAAAVASSAMSTPPAQVRPVRVVGDSDSEASAFLALLNDMPSPELVAFGPQLLSTCLSIICAPSQRELSLRCRGDAMFTLVTIAARIHLLEVSLLPQAERSSASSNNNSGGGGAIFSTPGTNRTTTLTLYLYNYVTRDLLFTGGKSYFAVAPLFVDVLCSELCRVDTPHYAKSKETYCGRIADVLWFLLDLVLRDVAMECLVRSDAGLLQQLGFDPASTATSAPAVAAAAAAARDVDKYAGTSVFSNKFLLAVRDLVKLCVTKLAKGGTLSVVQRLAVFLRSLLESMPAALKPAVLQIQQMYLELLEERTSLTFVLVALRFFVDRGAGRVLESWSAFSSSSANNAASCTAAASSPSAAALLPSPQLFYRMLLRPCVAAILGPRKDLRAAGIITLYNLFDEVARHHNSNESGGGGLATPLAVQSLVVLEALGFAYTQLRPLLEKHSELPATASGGQQQLQQQQQQQQQAKSPYYALSAGWSDRRQLAVLCCWILQYTPEAQLRAWTQTVLRRSSRIAAGVVALLGDALTAVHYTSGFGKVDRWSSASSAAIAAAAAAAAASSKSEPGKQFTYSSLPTAATLFGSGSSAAVERLHDPATYRIRQSADLRCSGACTVAVARLARHILLELGAPVLRGAAHTPMPPLVFPFFRLLECLVSESQPTLTLQATAALVLAVTRGLFAHISQGRGRMAPGMVLLAFRLIMSSSATVRVLGAAALLDMTRYHFAVDNNNSAPVAASWNTKLTLFRGLSSAAVISIAESYQHGRDMAAAPSCVQDGLDALQSWARSFAEAVNDRTEHVKFVAGEVGWDVSTSSSGTGSKRGDAESGNTDSSSGGASAPGIAASPVDAVAAANAAELAAFDFAPWLHFCSTVQPLDLTASTAASAATAPANSFNAAKQESTKRIDSYNNNSGASAPTSSASQFAAAIAALVRDHNELFRSIGALPADPEMRIRSARPAAFFKVVRTFLQHKALRDVPRWIALLQDTNRQNGDHLEAALAHVLQAAFAYRVAQVFGRIHHQHHHNNDASGGKSADKRESSNNNNTGAAAASLATPSTALPCVFFDIVPWHDYVRIFPGLRRTLSDAVVQRLVSDAVALPLHQSFTVAGQIGLLKAAAELFAKAHYFELALHAIRMVDKLVFARDDFKSCKVVAEAVSTWCGNIERAVTEAPHRLESKFFCAAFTPHCVDEDGYPAEAKSEGGGDDDDDRRKSSQLVIFRFARDSPAATLVKFLLLAREIAVARYRLDDPAQVQFEQDLSSLPIAAFLAPQQQAAAVASKPSAAPAPAAAAASASAEGATLKRLVKLHCFEVQPYFDDSEISTSVGDVHRSTNTQLHRFQISSKKIETVAAKSSSGNSNNGGADDGVASPSTPPPPRMSKQQLAMMSSSAKTLDATLQRRKVIVFSTGEDHCFPNVVTCLDVVSVAEQHLDPVMTALEIVNEQRQLVQQAAQLRETYGDAASAGTNKKGVHFEDGGSKAAVAAAPGDEPPPSNRARLNDKIVVLLFQALTPQDVRPAGFYFTHVLRTLCFGRSEQQEQQQQQHAALAAAIKELAGAIQAELEAIEETTMEQVDHLSLCWKGVVDTQCVLTDMELEQKQREEAAAAAAGGGAAAEQG